MIIAAITISIVFLFLLMMVIIFANIEQIIKAVQKDTLRKSLGLKSSRSLVVKEVSGEEYAAIAAAIYLYDNELHDKENTILTIEKTTRAWTPWNAKYFGMNNYFKKNR
jgi:Na+-transporting methylmalonyl-CoA/oxaloacetate decarboxylase gamma subunit